MLAISGLYLTGCASKNSSTTNGSNDNSGIATTSDKEQKKREALEEEIISSPMLITSDYFRQTAGTGKRLKLFGNSKKEKELEERLAKLEQRLKGLPERTTDSNGLPVLRRKVVRLSLLGDLGLDVLSVLPAALRRTEGLVPVPAEQLARLLEERGESVADLASVSVRREIASIAGIHAYILVYFAQDRANITGKTSAFRIDVIHAVESVLIGSYLATIDEFDTIAPKISEDVIRGTEWSCRIIKKEDGRVYLNAGRLTGLQPGDRLKVYGRGKELVDPITKRSLGFAPGRFKGEIRIENLFGTDASEASIISGNGFEQGDVVKMAQLA